MMGENAGMKIGYPCINRRIGCTANSTFRLASYSDERLIQAVGNNLKCLRKILEFNVRNGLLFFRIGSALIPFASHPVCGLDWTRHFRDELRSAGEFVRKHGMRISMHPDQFVLINAVDEGIVERSVKELEYHCRILDAMELDRTAKVQIHVGGVYGDKAAAIDRFVGNYERLPRMILNRLCIENDERLFGVSDCLAIHDRTGVPVVFDTFHHECLNGGEPLREAIAAAAGTWREGDGVLMVDYSHQAPGGRKGKHAESLDPRAFERFLAVTQDLEFDVMLEIKDKETSALRARETVRAKRLYP